MGYTALTKMREKNRAAYGIDFPAEVPKLPYKISNIERKALEFLRDTCERLGFEKDYENLADLDGKSLGKGQIPLHMEKDINRLCLENAVHRFMNTGNAEDAFDVYFCYLEMFIGSYADSKKMIEMLAEFESSASTLLMKHRDHYSHSVYVFVIGLALYQSSPQIRRSYAEFYQLPEDEAAHHYLKYWGLASLFHDIGYPFELAFEQVKSYFGNTIENVPFVSYKGLQNYVRLAEADRAALEKLLGRSFLEGTVDDVLADCIANRLEPVYGKDRTYIREKVFRRKASCPDEFNGYMDHAYFSGVVLFWQLLDTVGAENLTEAYLDAITAIVLHNSMYKFSITNIKDKEKNKPLAMELHPLAYLLMLCDELQCWDRISYGQNSKQELHSMWCDLKLEEDTIQAVYYYDCKFEPKKDSLEGSYRKMTDENQKFLKDIEAIICLNKENSLKLSITAEFAKNNRREKPYLSNTSFQHLYNFAVALNGRYSHGDGNKVSTEELEAEFENLSLEYKLSNIMQAKAFSRYLDAVDCFFTDKPVAYELLERFTERQMDIIGPLEHSRWLQEKLFMGWSLDAAYCSREHLEKLGVTEAEFKSTSKKLRELTRTHKLMIEDYNELDAAEQDKDTAPMNCMLQLIEQYDGLRIYRIG